MPRRSTDSTRRIANALVYYGIAGLVLAAIGLLILLVAASRLNGVTDRVEVTADRMLSTLDRTADLLDAAVVTVDDVASTLDAADPMLDRVAGSLTTTVASLRGLQQAAGAEDNALIADVETDVARDDINELLMGVLVRPRLVLRHELMQRHCRAGTGKRLAHYAFADGFPRHVFPIDFVQVHNSLLIWLRRGCPPAG